MDKREFLKSSSLLAAGSLMPRAFAQQANAPRENWAGNLTYSTNHLHTPATVDEVRKVVTSCDKLRALGTRHSFNSIADSTHNQISLKLLDKIEIDEKARTVTVGPGVTYGKLAPVTRAVSRCITSRRCLTSRSQALSPPQPTAPAFTTGTWPRLFLRLNS